MKLTLDQLRYLVALAEEGSFTRAAERVYLTQPALSVQIRKLEEALRTRLFDRRKGTLTEAGRVAVAQARRVLEEVERLRLLVQGEAACFQGPFRPGVIPTPAPYPLPPPLPHPKAPSPPPSPPAPPPFSRSRPSPCRNSRSPRCTSPCRR